VPDVFTPEKRSEVMSRIRGSDTAMEVRVRRWLHRRGYRFRKNDSRLPGKPDIVLPKYRTAIFVHGCFWHGHEGCKLFVTPKTRAEFWMAKIGGTRDRDRRNQTDLAALGWRTLVLWECDLERDFDGTLVAMTAELHNDERDP
jgi:DNA mismatch endonuclease (patch repair protein)